MKQVGTPVRPPEASFVIRGITAPASLKLALSTRVNSRLPAVIRGITAPASLKRGSRRPGGPGPLRYPGHNCPGLIEAYAIYSATYVLPNSYPGHNCPGLIEAILAIPKSERRALGYPGHNCPGLIEAHQRVSRRPCCSLVIRGITAPASLKPQIIDMKCFGLKLRYPGHNCPGLIEAPQ
ncbi:protein of unknown function [Candidatus Methylocalor cossyra]|uniref:Uncharacterized protein n=1 Tax=Candidatus Methylocalor cossyra TaxID=3108543 RepID=A0ABP1CA92_9GAMM